MDVKMSEEDCDIAGLSLADYVEKYKDHMAELMRQDDASAEEIRGAINALFRHQRLLPDDVLVCHAVQYKRWDLLRQLVPYEITSSLNPFLTAILAQDQDIIDFLIEQQEPLSVSGAAFNKEGKYVTVTLMYSVMRRDDAITLRKLLSIPRARLRAGEQLAGSEELGGGEENLLGTAVYHNAEACVALLLEMQHASVHTTRHLMLTAAMAKHSVLQRVLEAGCGDIRDASERGLSPLHKACDSMRGPDWSCDLFIPELCARLQVLIEHGARATACAKGHEGKPLYPIDVLIVWAEFRFFRDPRVLEEQIEEFLRGCIILLDQMRREALHPIFKVPASCMLHLQTILTNIFAKFVMFYTSSSTSFRHTYKETRTSHRCVALLVRLGAVYLRYGMDITDSELSFFDSWVRMVGERSMFVFGDELNEYVEEFMVTLLAYGCTITPKSIRYVHDLLEKPPAAMKNPFEPCVAMMSHDVYYQFVGEVEEAVRRGRGTEQELDVLRGFLARSWRSLKERCRLVLYDCVPHRNMVLHSRRLPLPRTLQLYLSLGVTQCNVPPHVKV